MLLQRLKKHLRQENWFAIVLELVIVIAGLFLAFQLDRWYEEQRLKADQIVKMTSLVADFAENEARLNQIIARAGQKMQAVVALRDEMRKDQPSLSVTQLNQLVAKTTDLATFQAVDITYLNIVGGGEAVELSNAELKKALADFYAFYELTKLIQNTQELQFVMLWQPYALNNLDYAASNRTAGQLRQKYMNDGSTLLPYIDPELILTAMKTKKFENMIVVQWETAEDLVNNWSDLLEKTKHIRALLNESIE
jgi:hypothetical protein